MRSIRILVNSVEIDFVREDLTINDDNNSFLDEFKVPHNTNPIRVIENEKTLKALGNLSIVTSGKKRNTDCVVFIGSSSYKAQLIQKTPIKGFRKCDIRFGSKLLEIKDKKISEFLGFFNVMGDNPETVPYTEDSDSLFGIDSYEGWNNEAKYRVDKIFPQILWQMPKIKEKDRVTTDDDLFDSDSPLFRGFRGYINNRYGNRNLVDNFFFQRSDGSIRVANPNAISPQVFLLSPLKEAFNSIGYRVTGDFYSDPFTNRVLFYSESDNLTTVEITENPIDVVFEGGIEGLRIVDGVGGNTNLLNFWFTFGKVQDVIVDLSGEFKLEGSYRLKYRYEIEEDGLTPSAFFGLQLQVNFQLVDEWLDTRKGVYEGEFNFEVEDGDVIRLIYHTFDNKFPTVYSNVIVDDNDPLEYKDFHPTIDFSRYLPDWTLITYINNLKKRFNLKIDIDDVANSISINYNKDYINSKNMIKLTNNFEINTFDNIKYESYIVRNENEVQDFVKITKDGLFENQVKDDDTKEIISPFKFLPSAVTTEITSSILDIDGVGLMIYEPINGPNTSSEAFGRNLKMSGPGSIFEYNWKKWLLFRLNSAKLKAKVPLSPTEVTRISQSKKIYANNQVFMIKKLKYKEDSSGLLETTMDLESLNY